MKLTDAELRQLHEEMTTPADRSECPASDLIVRAGEGRANTAEKQTVADHLGRCSDCAREYRLAVSMRPLIQESRGGRRRFVLPLAAAATVLLLLLPLIRLTLDRQRDAVTIAGLKKELATPRPAPAIVTAPADPVRPNLDAPIVDLDTDVVRGETTTIPKIVVPPGADVFTILLHLDEELRGPIELAVEGPASWKGTWTPPGPAAIVTMTLHRRQFPAGDYVVRAGSGKRIAPFRFRVEYR